MHVSIIVNNYDDNIKYNNYMAKNMVINKQNKASKSDNILF